MVAIVSIALLLGFGSVALLVDTMQEVAKHRSPMQTYRLPLH